MPENAKLRPLTHPVATKPPCHTEKCRFLGAKFFRLSGFFVAQANFASASFIKVTRLTESAPPNKTAASGSGAESCHTGMTDHAHGSGSIRINWRHTLDTGSTSFTGYMGWILHDFLPGSTTKCNTGPTSRHWRYIWCRASFCLRSGVANCWKICTDCISGRLRCRRGSSRPRIWSNPV